MGDEERYVQLLQRDGTLVLEGVAGIGKTFAIKALTEKLCPVLPREYLAALERVIASNTGTPKGDRLFEELAKLPICVTPRTSIFVMHPSTSYEEIIGGLRPIQINDNTVVTGKGVAAPTDEDSRGMSFSFTGRMSNPGKGPKQPVAFTRQVFRWMPGRLLLAIQSAIKDLPDNIPHLVVLDEINRCNLPSVLGELIYLIEPDRRVTPEKYKEAQDSKCPITFLRRQRLAVLVGPPEKGVPCFIPSNLYILGTMNSSDRSILGFDQALRRRFPPYRKEPMKVEDLVEKLEQLKRVSLTDELKTAINAWGCLNTLLRTVIGPDAMIGHSYWFNALERHDGSPYLAWRFGVLPQAIHAAESARREEFLADVFRTTEDAKTVRESVRSILGEYAVDKDRLRKAWKACHKKEQPHKDEEAMLEHLLAACVEQNRSLKIALSIVGDGHGEKLLIEDEDDGHESTGAKATAVAGAAAATPEAKQDISGSLPPSEPANKGAS
jgi:hypothetical protein